MIASMRNIIVYIQYIQLTGPGAEILLRIVKKMRDGTGLRRLKVLQRLFDCFDRVNQCDVIFGDNALSKHRLPGELSQLSPEIAPHSDDRKAIELNFEPMSSRRQIGDRARDVSVVDRQKTAVRARLSSRREWRILGIVDKRVHSLF